MKQIVLASGNQGKLKEFSQLFSTLNFEIIPQSRLGVDEVAETGTTFVENAIIKARNAAKVTGLAAIADDSGIEVDFLNGAPGIYSARYAGENSSGSDNYMKLLEALKSCPTQRSARFQCILVYLRHGDDPTPIICQASWEGSIGFEPKGSDGHGYDPIFIPKDSQQSAAQMNMEEKNHVSHRGKAMQLLLAEFKVKGLLG